MRVALVTEDYYPDLGGIPEHVHHLARELRRRGHTAIVITSRPPGYQRHDPCVERVGTGRLLYNNGAFARVTVSWGLERRLEGLLREGRYDLVHVHRALVPTLGIVAPRAALRLGIPVVGTFHSWLPRSLGYALFRRPLQRLLNRFAAAIAVSAPVVATMSRYFDADWEIIPNGVDLEVFRPGEGPPPDSAPRGPALLFLGRLDPRNGLRTLLAAMPRVAHTFPSALLTVAGSGPLRRYYERCAEPLGPNARFIGPIHEERAAYYRAADLYLCPATRASFGVTLLEAMACGTPLIASDIPAFRDLLDAGADAVLVPMGDPRAWARAAIDLLADAERRRALRDAGLTKATRFAWPLIGQRVLQVYKRVLG